MVSDEKPRPASGDEVNPVHEERAEGSSPKTEPPSIEKEAWGWLLRRFGKRTATVIFLIVAAGLAAWIEWDKFANLPGIRPLVSWIAEAPLPKADTRRFAVAVAHLDNDPAGANERLIVEALNECPWVQVLRFDRAIRTDTPDPEVAVAQGHERACSYLEESGAQILIWGTVLAHDNQSLPKLYMTTSERATGQRAPQRYILGASDLSLPELFWSDLVEVLRLVVATTAADFNSSGQFVADRLIPFIARARSLLSASDSAGGWTRETRATVTFAIANSLLALGEQEGTNEPLGEALSLYRQILTDWIRDSVPIEWARTQNNLGNALVTLGERESGTARLEEAVAAYRAALEELTRDRVPLEWAIAQNNLASALRILGERESATDHLKEAVATHRTALEELPRDRVPLDWAMTQNNLGNALVALGERESGTAHLEEAVDAYRAAVAERTRDRVPLDWAMTQNNLGNALRILGERESGTTHLEEAAVAFRAALEERTRDRVPLDWAMTQSNLGIALRSLGERESGTAHLEEAAAAFRSALQQLSRDHVPLDWATTQNNLGNALVTLGERESGTADLEGAVEAYRAALEERTRDRGPLQWAMTQNNLGNALVALGERELGTGHLEEAVAVFRAALEERTRDRVPLDWASTQNNLGNALLIIAGRTASPTVLCEALRCHLEALLIYIGKATYYESLAAGNVQRDLDSLAGNFPADLDACLQQLAGYLARFREIKGSADSAGP